MAIEFPRRFALSELIRTDTGIDNTPGWEHIDNIRNTGLKLDRIRDKFGHPIRVNCCFRSKAVNDAVGGVSTSAHLLGLSADIKAYNGKEYANRALYALIVGMVAELDVDQLILYTVKPGDKTSEIRFMHVGWRSGKEKARHQLLFK